MAINDGSANAPVGSPQLPNLLDTYGANVPAWNVAGVDYYVGVPQGLTLKDPATISMAGVSVDVAHKSITVTGNNVTLSGYDFGGWSVVTAAANTSLINSNFNGLNPGGSQSSVISGTSSSSNLYVGYSTIDGLSGGGHAEFLVEMQGPGLTIEYSWLKNSNSDLVGRHGVSGGDITIQYNVMQQAGMGGSGTHGDYLQVYGPTIESTHILYNTAVQNGGITQGFIADNTKSGEFAGNVLIGSVSSWMSVSGPGTDPANLTSTFSTHDNYFDITKAYFFNYPAVGPDDRYSKTAFIHNVNMVTGQVEQDSNAPSVPTTPSAPAPSAPTIASFSSDSGVAGDGITYDNTLTLTGTAAANGTVKVFDGATQIATATANSSGAWTLTSAQLMDGSHSLTATDTVLGTTSSASAALAVTIDTVAPKAPVEVGDSIVNGNQVQLNGTAEANSTLQVYDGTTLVGTTTTNATGNWTVMTSSLSTGAHDLTATATDAAGNTSAVSLPLDPVIGTAPTSAVGLTTLSENSSHIVTIKGTADAYSQITLYDGATSLGTVATAADGTWSFKTSSAVSNTVHAFTAQEIDSTGHVVASSGSAILGSTGNNALTSTAGNDLFVGHGGKDTFVFAPNFGNDVITDFSASGRSHDFIQFSKSVFDSFASVLAQASQVGQDVVISADASDSVTLKNTKLSALNSQDFHFA